MADIIETRLPGVGVRHDFITTHGERLGIITHHGGRRELIVCGAGDPDVCRDVVRLEESDVRALAEVLGQSHISESQAAAHLGLQGLALDWIQVTASAFGASSTLHDVEHADESPATIVAVIRDGKTIAAPPSSFELLPGDTAVAVGTPEGTAALARLLSDGTH